MSDATRAVDLLVIGDCNPDLILSGNDVVPAFGQQEKIVESAGFLLGGSGAITAVQAAKLGLHTAFVGMVGDDHLGRWCIEELSAAGVDVSGCVSTNEVPTGLTAVFSRGRDRGMLTYPGAVGHLRASDVQLDLVAGSRHVHFGGFFLHPLLAGDVAVLASAAGRGGASTSLDPNWDPSERWDSGIGEAMRSVDVMFANEAEVRGIAGGERIGDAADMVAQYCPSLVMKRGEDGAVMITGSISLKRSLPLEEGASVVDTTGAGDSFDAGFIAGRLAGLSDADSLLLGCYCGARVVTAMGGTAAQPNKAEVERDLGFQW